MGASYQATVSTGEETIAVRATKTDPASKLLLVPSVGEYPIYDPLTYKMMVADEARNAGYRKAIEEAVPGKVVVEIGTGQDALWSLHSARSGAARVYAIEAMPESARLARKAIAEAGYSDVITVLDGLSTQVELPERADVCVSEIIGTIGGSEGAAVVLADVRARFLKPGGVFVPDRCVTTLAAVDLDRVAPGTELAFQTRSLRYLRQMFDAVGGPFDPRLCLFGLTEQALVSDQTEVEDLRFNQPMAAEGLDRRELTATADGRVHGFALGIRLWAGQATKPVDSLRDYTNWAPVYVPVSEAGVPVRAGDRVVLDFRWSPGADGVHPDYHLYGEIRRADAPNVSFAWHSAHGGGHFRSSPVYAALFPQAS
ncbi:protein arginine N-methyltransferase 1 [Crossiella equi]|uniref:Protein arginine N-methyltransferase 1 n=1 Tax=Crossiella equi TaxID=130796 RepID=A0ABS5ALQ8_9PSEU|nr:hypothetical protein [Crossiella equi]MBP2477496.1 protein arginine N-methyltransferase 1 [Crossiella equi]